jgi:hypothetical protein
VEDNSLVWIASAIMTTIWLAPRRRSKHCALHCLIITPPWNMALARRPPSQTPYTQHIIYITFHSIACSTCPHTCSSKPLEHYYSRVALLKQCDPRVALCSEVAYIFLTRRPPSQTQPTQHILHILHTTSHAAVCCIGPHFCSSLPKYNTTTGSHGIITEDS